MKKIFSIVLVMLLSIFSFFDVSAAEKLSFIQKESALNDNSFIAKVSLNPGKSFAGVEFGVVCPEGVVIEKVEFNMKGSQAGPKITDNKTWFSIFSGDNDFSGKVILTISGTCNERETLDLDFSNVKVYVKDGVNVITEETSESQIISLNRKSNGNNIVSNNQSSQENSQGDSSFSGIVKTNDKIKIMAALGTILFLAVIGTTIFRHKKKFYSEA